MILFILTIFCIIQARGKFNTLKEWKYLVNLKNLKFIVKF